MGIDELKNSFNSLQELYVKKNGKQADADELINYARSQNTNIFATWDTLFDGDDKVGNGINSKNYYADGDNLLFQSETGEITAFNLNDGSVRMATNQDMASMLDALDDDSINNSISADMINNSKIKLGSDKIDFFESLNLKNKEVQTEDKNNSKIIVSSSDTQQILAEMANRTGCANIHELMQKFAKDPNSVKDARSAVSDYLLNVFGNGDAFAALQKLTDAEELPKSEEVLQQAFDKATDLVFGNIVGSFTDKSKTNHDINFVLGDINASQTDLSSVKTMLKNQVDKERVMVRHGDGGYGFIDWNNDGTFGNEGSWNDSFIAKHGQFDQFYTSFGKTWTLPELEEIVNSMDNSANDKDSRAGFVSNGIITAHKISDKEIGFNVTEQDMSRGAGFSYNYAVWNKEKNTYLVGTDKNNDGNLTGDEVKCMVDNVGKKTSSPLTFDLNGDGVKTSANEINYDIDGDGKQERINDADDGVLSIRGGDDGSEVFGNNTDLDGDGKADGFKNGFDALKALARKENLINDKDDMVLSEEDIALLEAKYDFGIKKGYNAKSQSLESLGITEISLANTDETELTENFDGRDNDIMTQKGSKFKINGEERDYADVWNKHLKLEG